MFTAITNKAVSFPSSWRTEQQLTFSDTQTENIECKESECQVVHTTECGIQTDEIKLHAEFKESDEDGLLEFLRRIAPKVEDELKKQERSMAFESYNGLKEEAASGVALQHTLRWPGAEGVVTGLSWSSTGAVIAVSYGMDTHDMWCQHRSAVAVWNINRCEGVSNVPERLLEVPSCVPAIAFHPTKPSILAVSTRTGDVYVYDLSDSESVTPIVTGYTGGSGVTCLVWLKTGSTLAAATQGGQVLLWTLSFAKQTLTLDEGFVIVQSDLPRQQRPASNVSTSNSESIGITTLSFNSEDPTVFIVGVDGGSLLLCTTRQQNPVNMVLDGTQCRRCVLSNLSGHSGRILSAQLSPHHRNAALSLGSDDNLKIHSLLQPLQPVNSLYSDLHPTCAIWSPTRALLLALANTTGQVQFLDACNVHAASGEGGSSLLELPPPEKPAPVTALAFNAASLTLIAIGDAFGRVWVWRLPEDIVSQHTTDLPRLTSLLSQVNDD